jgi:hypothetical protein
MRIKFLSLFIFVFIFKCSAQVLNIDREIKDDSSSKPYEFSANLNFSSNKQRKSLIDGSNTLELVRNYKNRYALISLLRTDFTFIGGQSLQNKGTFHLRYRDRDQRKYSAELFLQNQWNGIWGMEYRFLAGVNFRMRLQEKDGKDLYLGTGIFSEMERWNWSGVETTQVPPNPKDVYRHWYRLNQYLKYSTQLGPQADMTMTSYLQFPLNGYFLQPRWYLEWNTFVHLGKHASLMIHWDHNLDAETALPISSFYYNFSTGLQVGL